MIGKSAEVIEMDVTSICTVKMHPFWSSIHERKSQLLSQPLNCPFYSFSPWATRKCYLKNIPLLLQRKIAFDSSSYHREEILIRKRGEEVSSTGWFFLQQHLCKRKFTREKKGIDWQFKILGTGMWVCFLNVYKSWENVKVKPPRGRRFTFSIPQTFFYGLPDRIRNSP